MINKYEIIKKIEQFAPPETAEGWDCVGFMVETDKIEVSKIMLCLTVTEDIVKQAKMQQCDMIISHHPMFEVECHSELVSESYSPLIDIYSAHTNLDKAIGGTTDTLIKSLGFEAEIYPPKFYSHEFLRFVDFEDGIEVETLGQKLQKISPNLRYVNNYGQKIIKRVAFCAGSGSEFIKEARNMGADCLVTGDLKFHTALDSEIVLFDIGHFESEILILPVLKDIIENEIEVVFAKEQSPFLTIDAE